jgi:hypothetical protein
MASPFANVGLGMLGSEQNYMHDENPLSTAFKGVKDYAILRGMEKTGLFDYLNKLGENKQAMMDKYPGLSAKKPDGSAAPPAAADTSTSVDAIQNVPISDEAADNLFKNTSGAQPNASPTKVLAPSTFKPGAAAPPPANGAQFSGVSPNVIQPRNMGQDQLAMDATFAAPPQMKLPQYGSGSNSIASTLGTIATLAKFFI